MLFKRKTESPWDGQRFNIEQLGASLAVCSREGFLLGASPRGADLLSRVGVDVEKLPSPLPNGLWQTLTTNTIGQAVDWRPNDDSGVCLGCTLYLLGSSFYMLDLLDVSGKQDLLSIRLHHQRQQALSRFAATVAHDLRAPLSSIIYNVELLRREWPGMPAGQIDQLLEEISESCRWQARCIASVLDSAKLYPQEAVKLSALFSRLKEVVHPAFRDRQYLLEVEVDQSHLVRGTPLLLEHIFLNIINNAAEAAEGSVTVEVKSERASVSGEGDQATQAIDKIRVSISDNGPGIPQGVRPQIFDPFYSTKGSNGIGLTLARQAARELGGDVRLVSSSVGARFEVDLLVSAPRGATG